MQENGIDTGDRYKYKKAIKFWKTIQVKVSNSSQPSIQELIELSSRQESKQASEHPSEAKQCWGQHQRTKFNHQSARWN